MGERRSLAMHLDGARLFNAALAQTDSCRASGTLRQRLGLSFERFGRSSGFGFGGFADADEAKRWRKVLGGGMRQAGVIAAAGLYALKHQIDDLAQDHRHAEQLAQ